MSADLFAEFGTVSQEPQQRQTSSSSTTTAVADPFAFLSSSSSQAPPQTQQWAPSPMQASTGIAGQDPWSKGSEIAVATGASHATEDEDDTWGDFEVASPIAPAATPPSFQVPSAVAAVAAPTIDLQHRPKTRVVRASTIDLMTNNLIDLAALSGLGLAPIQETPPKPKPMEQTRTPPRPKSTNSDVLFDADDFDLGEVAAQEDDDDDGDDDFGEFETVAPPPASAGPALDILSAEWSSVPAPISLEERKQPPSQLLSTQNLNGATALYPQPPKSPSFQERNPFPGLAVTTPIAAEFPHEENPRSPSPATAWPTLEQVPVTKSKKTGGGFDEWGADKGNGNTSEAPPGWDWDAVDGVEPQPRATGWILDANQNKQEQPAESAADWNWDAVDPEPITAAPPVSAASRDTPPPTNIPPTSIILSLFTTLLDLPNTALFKPTVGQPSAVRDRILSDPKTVDFLRGFLLLATVAARIMAGRKLRWHRDKFLAQGMTISAAGGKGGGMKLTGVDKTQAMREDREAADVLTVWCQNVGRLRSAVATANSTLADTRDPLRVPELGDNMTIQTAKVAPAAPRACIVCGLKRDERVKGVDFEVEDSFGDWWTEHWGHRACKNFWLQHEARLRSK